MDVDTLLTTTRSVRKRLDLERPVPRDVVEECLNIGLQAANGGNHQVWRWLLIDDPLLREGLADIYREGVRMVRAQLETGEHFEVRSRAGAMSPKGGERERMLESVQYLADHLERVPVHVIPLVPGRPQAESLYHAAGFWAAIFPGVWNFMLALRSRGLGSAWTTVHLTCEREAADLLGIPHDRYTQVGLFPVAYTIGTTFRPGPRRPLEEVIGWNGISTL
jgi:nitroreductase